MKSKKACFLTFLLVTVLSCSGLLGQLNFAVTGGINISKFNSILWGRDYYNLYQSYLKYHWFPNLGFEIMYTRDKFKYLTGVSYSYRGGRDYAVPKVFFSDGYVIDMNGYLEVPIQVYYSYYRYIYEIGLGIVLHKRVETLSAYYDERNKYFGFDLRFSHSWNMNRSLAISTSYTLGNLDKYIHNTYGNFLHHVFAINLRYTFLHYQFKAARQHKPVRQNR